MVVVVAVAQAMEASLLDHRYGYAFDLLVVSCSLDCVVNLPFSVQLVRLMATCFNAQTS